ncbi:secretion protein EspN [Salmonella enterica subsp. arizonae]|nr:secretion protein EspN [Salmonella enterica subsp. arizonae]
MKAAIDTQLNWAEKYYKAVTHVKDHIQDCDVLGLMNINKMLRDTVVGLIHEISDIAQSSWLTAEDQHEKTGSGSRSVSKVKSHPWMADKLSCMVLIKSFRRGYGD